MTAEDWIRPADLSAAAWGEIDEVWESANQGLDKGLAMYRAHREATTCPHPTCVGADFAESMDRIPPDILKGLLHAAIHRLEVLRLEKEAGL